MYNWSIINEKNQYYIALIMVDDVSDKSHNIEGTPKSEVILKILYNNPENKEFNKNKNQVLEGFVNNNITNLGQNKLSIDESKLLDFNSIFLSNINFDLGDNLDDPDVVYNKNLINMNHTKWGKYINYLFSYLKSNISLSELLCIQRVLRIFYIVNEHKQISGITEYDKKLFKLKMFLLRMYVMNKITKQVSNDTSYDKKNYLKSYLNEYKRFTDFLSNESFIDIVIEKEVFELFSDQINSNNMSFDRIIDYLLNSFMEIKNLIIQQELATNDDITIQLKTVYNTFYLSRYSIFDNKIRKHIKIGSSKIIPRLFASITVGFIPVLLTGEIYDWYKALFLNSFKYQTLLLAAIIFFQILIVLYIRTEINKFVGSIPKFRFWYIYGVGNLLAIFLVFLGSSFTHTMITSENTTIPNDLLLWSIYEIPTLLLIFQVSVSFLFGLVLQTIWEDKPITQPL